MIVTMEYARSEMDGYRALADLHRALAHPVRLRILDVLARREACVCHLTAVLGLRQPYVSQQLGALRDAGVVVSRREGTLIYYRLRDARLAGLLALGQSLTDMSGTEARRAPAMIDGAVAGCQCPACQAGHDGAEHGDRVPATSAVAG